MRTPSKQTWKIEQKKGSGHLKQTKNYPPALRCTWNGEKANWSQKVQEAEYRKIDAEIAKLMAETMRINAEAQKITVESGKITKETFWYPMLIASGLITAIIALKLFL